MRPIHQLTIGGKVERFAAIRPKYVHLRGLAGNPVKSVVSVTPEKKYPFKVTNVRVKTGTFIKASLEERQSPKGNPVFAIMVENLKREVGRYHDQIILETDSPLRPTLAIAVYGNIVSKEKPPQAGKPKPAAPAAPKKMAPQSRRVPGKGDSLAMD